MLQRLIWKDVATVRPLMWAALTVVAVLNLFLFLLWQNREVTDASLVGLSITLWILVPHLVAFGVPAMLIGTEEEQGTLRWIRSLPVHWKTVADAKLLVGIGATAIAWLITSSVLYLFSFGWSQTSNGADFSLVTPSGILMVLLNSAMLLMLGFMMAYWIRSPLIALMTLVLIYSFVCISYFSFADWMNWDHDWSQFSIVFGVGVAIVLLAWGLQMLFARKRLLLPIETNGFQNRDDLPVYTYRPPVSIAPRRPTEMAALFWQQVRQTAPLCIALVGMANLLVLIFRVSHPNGFLNGPIRALGFFSVPFVVLCGSWLGASVFYGDTIRHRCGFFADRGISPTKIWITRIAPPAVACVLLLLSIGLLWFNFSTQEFRQMWGSPWQFIVLIIVLFAFGQLVSQWTDRPLLAFFAAPAYAFICLMPIFYLIERFNASLFVIALTAPVLLFATWRQTGRWLDGRKKQYVTHVIAYTAVAILLPCLMIPTQAFLLPNISRFARSAAPVLVDPQPLAQVALPVDTLRAPGFTP